jgi:hypothetical protein
MFLTAGCSSSGSRSSGVEEPVEKQDISGVWWGYFGSTFTIGMITQKDNGFFSVRLIGQDKHNYKQFISPDSSPLVQQTLDFSGNLDDVTWDTSGFTYKTLSPRPLSLMFAALGGRQIGPLGAFFYEGDIAEKGQLFLIYNTTYGVTPNVNNISGQWEIHDAIQKNNTIVLTISPNAADTNGTGISGHDDHGNTFDGSITIYVSPLDNKPHNIYNVNIKLNNSIDLTGLAAYVIEANTEGINVSKKTLAIGATNKDRSYSLSGLAEFIK